ncbi:mechanosensitive ion channel family protein [Fluviicola sp.]|uniref:mechanosensitive ion channel family protein n=1 Tax=Fluviicola sp. TaxID=1917219 RepID=UPI0031DE17C2
MEKFLQHTFWGNTVYSWLFALGIVIVSVLGIRLFRYVVLKRLKTWSASTSATWDDLLVIGIERLIVPILYVGFLYFAISTLQLSPKADKVIHIIYMAALTFCVLRLISAVFRRLLMTVTRRRSGEESGEQSVSGLMIVLNVVIWILGIIFLIDNLGYSVTTLITGLGIGGIAVALAAQTILGDLFSYFSIFFDKPFEIGDSITIGDQSGTVEKIGIKTTRIRTLSGDQLVCSNSDLTNSRVNNFKRLETRRIVFTLRVVYNTPSEVLEEIPGLVKNIIDKQPQVEYGRGHLAALGDWSINFEFVYNVLSPDYGVYMDVQHAIYMEIIKVFKERSISFAFPTQPFLTGDAEAEGETETD